MAVMGVALQWDSHTRTREGQLWGPSEVLKDGPGIGNTASLKSSCYRISVIFSGLRVSAPFLLNSVWLGSRVSFYKENDRLLYYDMVAFWDHMAGF